MSDSTAGLRQQIESATDLQAVVRTMKALAASSIGQYEAAVRALADYYSAVEVGLGACFRNQGVAGAAGQRTQAPPKGHRRDICAVVFGSDQGLVGRFNEQVADHAVAALTALQAQKAQKALQAQRALPAAPHHSPPPALQVWAVGERVHARLQDAGLQPLGCYPVPASINTIAPLVGRILVESQARDGQDEGDDLHLFYNSTRPGAGYAPMGLQLLPLDDDWRRARAALPWPSQNLPQVMAGGSKQTLSALIGEFLFVSLFRACAESLASENASRLAAMERADRNIDELLQSWQGSLHRVRQSSIDAELFDLVAGFEALRGVGT